MSTSTSYDDPEIIDEREVDASAGLMAINKSEIDQQIATAKKYPRSIKRFLNTAREMVTLSEEIAGECIYSLPRGGKPIEGPSARFAEVIAHAWGNCRAGARVIDEDARFVTAQGVFIDCEANVAITYEVRRRITNKKGDTFNDDMIGVTANAACSIALRNSVLKGIPKAFWKQLYDEARKTAIGSAETLVARRVKMLKAFATMGVRPEQVFSLLEIKGEEDIGLDHLAALRGVFTAIKEGDTTIEDAFAGQPATGGKVTRSPLNEKLNGNGGKKQDIAADAEKAEAEAAQKAAEGSQVAGDETGALPGGQMTKEGTAFLQQIKAAGGNSAKLTAIGPQLVAFYKAQKDCLADPEAQAVYSAWDAAIEALKKK